MNMKITVLGDSNAKGITYKNQRLTHVENSAVDLVGKAFDCTIENLSAYGQTITKIMEKDLITKIIKNKVRGAKNYVLIYIGGNDADYNWKEVEQEPNVPHPPKTDLTLFVDIYKQIIEKLKKNGFIVHISTIMPINANCYFENVISKYVDRNKVLEFLHSDLTNISRHQELFNNEIIKLSNVEKVKLIDLRKILLQENNCFSNFCEDGVHLNEKGHQKIANCIINEYKNKKGFIN